MPDEPRNTIALALKRWRLAAALTQEELADRAGVSARTISDIERGLRGAVYSDTARRLADALGLSGADRQRFESLLRGREPLVVPGETVPFVPTPLFGRASELRAVITALTASGAQLLTLTGPGGIGKSRLALEVAHRLRESFPDGVVFVQLGEVDTAALVASTIARAIGVIETGEQLELLIVRRLVSRRMLILLDTFEHVIEAAAFVSSLLARHVQAIFLVTSRRPLHIRGELEFPVPALDLPRALGEDFREDLAHWPATALFIDRALAVSPNLALASTEAALVLEICHKLDGLPLAIELCAARVKHLPLRALAEQLDHRLQVLTGGPTDLPVRQRTMRETVGWSHDLLPPATRILFRRLAVFSGGCDLGSIEEVCGELDRQVADAIDGTSTLVDHSLLTLTNVDGSPRYEMLDVIAEFAAERLAEAGETSALARRHALRYLDLAEEAEPNLVRATQRESLRRLDLERANLRRAIAWTIEQNETTLALRFTVALWRYWRHVGELAEGRRWCEATLTLPGAGPDGLRAKALWGTAFLAYPQGDYRRMAELASEDLTVARRGGDAMDLRNALTIVGQVALCEGRHTDALGPLREALMICQAFGVTWHLGTSHLNLGNALLHSGAVEEAERTYRDGLRVYRELGDETFAARMCVAIAHAALKQGDPDEAERLSRQALASLQASRERLGIAEALDVLAAVAAWRAEGDRAARLDGAATRIQETIASRPAPFERAVTGALIGTARASMDGERWLRAWEEGRSLGIDEAIQEGLEGHGASIPAEPDR